MALAVETGGPASPSAQPRPGLGALLDRLEELLVDIGEFDEPIRATVFELLDGIDALHRLALARLAEAVGLAALGDAKSADGAVRWLLEAYGVGVDERAAAEAALETVRPYVGSHGGRLELLGVSGGRVRLRMGGSCSGCSASAVTLAEGVEEALRAGLPGFVAVEVEEDEGAVAHPPPGPTLVEIGRKER